MSTAIVLHHVWASAKKPVQSTTESEHPRLRPELAFYRKYTEGMLRRYARMSMEAGRVPSMLGRELFRSHVTNYRVQSFDDVVIFVHDVERCIQMLGPSAQRLIERIGVQEFTQQEVARFAYMSERTVVRRYCDALDALTQLFLERHLLEPLVESALKNSCQEAG